MRDNSRARTVTPVEQFQDLARKYAELQKDLRGKLPALKDRAEAERIAEHEKLLQAALRNARADAKQGDIFIPEVRAYFVRVVRSELAGAANREAREAVKDTNPRGGAEKVKPFPLRVNALYPKEAVLTTIPPSLLLKLPRLPEVLEYRFVGKHLILRDTTANLIVDYLTEVAP